MSTFPINLFMEEKANEKLLHQELTYPPNQSHRALVKACPSALTLSLSYPKPLCPLPTGYPRASYAKYSSGLFEKVLTEDFSAFCFFQDPSVLRRRVPAPSLPLPSPPPPSPSRPAYLEDLQVLVYGRSGGREKGGSLCWPGHVICPRPDKE